MPRSWLALALLTLLIPSTIAQPPREAESAYGIRRALESCDFPEPLAPYESTLLGAACFEVVPGETQVVFTTHDVVLDRGVWGFWWQADAEGRRLESHVYCHGAGAAALHPETAYFLVFPGKIPGSYCPDAPDGAPVTGTVRAVFT